MLIACTYHIYVVMSLVIYRNPYHTHWHVIYMYMYVMYLPVKLYGAAVTECGHTYTCIVHVIDQVKQSPFPASKGKIHVRAPGKGDIHRYREITNGQS